MITFHRIVFCCFLGLALIKGGVDAGRKDMLNMAISSKMLTLTLRQLGDIEVQS
jgi:hypothetical protein